MVCFIDLTPIILRSARPCYPTVCQVSFCLFSLKDRFLPLFCVVFPDYSEQVMQQRRIKNKASSYLADQSAEALLKWTCTVAELCVSED